MTGRRGLALLSYLAAYLHLSVIANEPGHPQELLGIILVALPALACVGTRGRFPWPALVMGGLSAAAVLIKVNVGLFVTVSATAAILASAHANSSLSKNRWGRFWRPTAALSYGLIGIGAMALPFYLMKSQLAEPWALRYAAIISAATLPVLLLAWFGTTRERIGQESGEPKPLTEDRVEGTAFRSAGPGVTYFIAFAIAGLATTACLVTFVVMRGTTLWGLFHSLVILPGQVFAIGQWGWPTPTSVWSPVICLVSVVLAVCHLRRHGYRRSTREHLGTLICVLKAAVAVWTLSVVSKWRIPPIHYSALPCPGRG